MPYGLNGGSEIPALTALAKDIARIVETIELLDIRSTPTGKRDSGKNRWEYANREKIRQAVNAVWEEPRGTFESGKDSFVSEGGLVQNRCHASKSWK
jgi:hypothetical protein